MEHYRLHDLEIIFDHAGRDDWGKFSFPVWYGIPVKIHWLDYEFHFNLSGSLKRIRGNSSVWPDPMEWLKRTDADDLIYYGSQGYKFSYDLIKSYYIPYTDRYNSEVFTETPLKSPHVERALSAFDRLVDLRYTDSSVRSSDALMKLANGMRAQTHPDGDVARTAVVAPKDVSYGLGRMFLAMTDADHNLFKIFKSFKAACAWLCITPALFDRDMGAGKL